MKLEMHSTFSILFYRSCVYRPYCHDSLTKKGLGAATWRTEIAEGGNAEAMRWAKRQADEFEAQNRLMKNSAVWKFLFKQLEYLNYLSNSIHFENKNGLEAISKIADCIYFCAKIVRCDNIADRLYSLNEEQQSKYDANWKMFQTTYNDLLPWVHKFYSFIRRIRNMDMLNGKEKNFTLK